MSRPTSLREGPVGRVLIPLVFWLGVWQVLSATVGLELTLPGPAAVAARLWALGGTGQFWLSALFSLLRVFCGFLCGGAAAVLLAAAAAASPWADRVFSPAVRLVRAVPVVSFIFLVLLWTDKNITPAVVAGLMVLPVVWENTLRGIRETDPLLVEMAGAYRFGRWRTIRLIYLPSALPYAASGCRTGLGLAWKSGVAAEALCVPLLAAGTQIYRAKLYYETADLFAWTAVVVALSILMEAAMGRLLRGR